MQPSHREALEKSHIRRNLASMSQFDIVCSLVKGLAHLTSSVPGTKSRRVSILNAGDHLVDRYGEEPYDDLLGAKFELMAASLT